MGRIDGRQPRPYVMVDRELIGRFTPNELALYIVLLSYLISDERKTDRQCWPGHEELANACGWSVDTVQRTLKKLASYGLLTSTRRGSMQSNLYTLATVDADGEMRALPPSDTAPVRRHDAAKPPRSDAARMRYEEEECEVEEGKKNNRVEAMSSLSPSVPRAPAQTERDQIFIHLAHEHGVNADRLAQVAREHGATPEEFAGAWRIASDPYYADQEYRNSFRDYLGAWIKAPTEVREDLESYRDKRDCDARQAEYAARGPCDFHWQPQPCRGCAADAKAVNDDEAA